MKRYIIKYKINDIVSQIEIQCAGYCEINGIVTFNTQYNNIFSINKEYLILIIDCDEVNKINDYISEEELNNLKLIKKLLIELSENDVSVYTSILKIEAKGCVIFDNKINS